MAAAPLGNIAGAMGRGGQAYGQSLYQQEQDEKRRLDLRAREEALSKYRGLTSAASMERAQKGSQEPTIDFSQLEGSLDPAVIDSLSKMQAAGLGPEAGTLLKQILYRETGPPGKTDEEKLAFLTEQEKIRARYNPPASQRIYQGSEEGAPGIAVDPKTLEVTEVPGVPSRPQLASKQPKSMGELVTDLRESQTRFKAFSDAYIRDELSGDKQLLDYKMIMNGIERGWKSRPEGLVELVYMATGERMSEDEAYEWLAQKHLGSKYGGVAKKLSNREISSGLGPD
jgi:hypothetical protein